MYVCMYVCCTSKSPYVTIGYPTMNRRCGRRTAYAQSILANKCVFFLKQTVISIFLMLLGSLFHISSDHARVKDLNSKADRSLLGLKSNLCGMICLVDFEIASDRVDLIQLVE